MGFGADEVYYPAMTAYTLTGSVVRSAQVSDVGASQRPRTIDVGGPLPMRQAAREVQPEAWRGMVAADRPGCEVRNDLGMVLL